MALVHHPVVNKQGETIASAVTNLDIHDIARALRTYGGQGVYIVTPLTDQQVLTNRIVSHWTEGAGGARHPKRKQALELVCVVDSLEAACEDIRRREGISPRTVITSAKVREGSVSFSRIRGLIEEGQPVLLVFGTAWGLSEEILERADHCLVPIMMQADYNHLSVRSAVSIMLDRLVGDRTTD